MTKLFPNIIPALCLIFLFSSSVKFLYAHESNSESIYEKSINHSARLESDRKYDKIRNPASILPFTQISEGNVVLELGAGGGYTTELISRIVGNSGKVYAHRLYSKERVTENRLPNVVPLRDHSLFELNKVLTENKITSKGLDAIVIFFALHDIYLNSEMNEQVMKTLYSSLKPGGLLIVLDNAAEPRSGLTATESLHRIGENFVVAELTKAGFVVDGNSDVLRNKEDDHTKPWGDFKGMQDRFAIRFKKR